MIRRSNRFDPETLGGIKSRKLSLDLTVCFIFVSYCDFGNFRCESFYYYFFLFLFYIGYYNIQAGTFDLIKSNQNQNGRDLSIYYPS